MAVRQHVRRVHRDARTKIQKHQQGERGREKKKCKKESDKNTKAMRNEVEANEMVAVADACLDKVGVSEPME